MRIGLFIQLILSRFCSRKAAVEHSSHSSLIWLVPSDNITSMLQHSLEWILSKLRKLPWTRWWDMRMCSYYITLFLCSFYLLTRRNSPICRYVDPSDPTRIFLQQPHQESELRRRTYQPLSTSDSMWSYHCCPPHIYSRKSCNIHITFIWLLTFLRICCCFPGLIATWHVWN